MPETGRLFEDFNLLRAAALCGQGIALCPEVMIHRDLASGHLIRLSRIKMPQDCSYRSLQGPFAGVTSSRAIAFRSRVPEQRDRDKKVPGPTR